MQRTVVGEVTHYNNESMQGCKLPAFFTSLGNYQPRSDQSLCLPSSLHLLFSVCGCLDNFQIGFSSLAMTPKVHHLDSPFFRDYCKRLSLPAAYTHSCSPLQGTPVPPSGLHPTSEQTWARPRLLALKGAGCLVTSALGLSNLSAALPHTGISQSIMITQMTSFAIYTITILLWQLQQILTWKSIAILLAVF